MNPVALRVPTPEGVDLHFEIAGAGDRLGALVIDALLIGAMLLGLLLLLQLIGFDSDAMRALVTVAAFCVRTFYFTWHESRRNGVTPGKRRLGLRVVRADGGPLELDAILARNFTREAELFLPLTFLLAPDLFWPDGIGVLRLVAGLWVLVLLVLPLLNRHRMRIGDMVAGTRVVLMPRVELVPDLVPGRPAPTDAATAAGDQKGRPHFTKAQLEIYGIAELQVLENVLRRANTPSGPELLRDVARRIKKRIGWEHDDPSVPDRRFLEEFYAAQRRNLEQHLLFGRRRERKVDKPKRRRK